MSYILDALRKSDQQRQRGAVPTLLTPQANVIEPKQPVFLLHGSVVVVLIVAGILIGWMRPWESGRSVPATVPFVDTPLDSRQPGKSIPPTPVLTESAINPDRQLPVQISASAATVGSVPTSAGMKPSMPAVADSEIQRTPSKPAGAATREVATSVARADGTAQTKSAGDQRVISMSELPISIQQEIPRMSVAVHAYSSNPNSRLVMINDRLLHEGAQVDPSLRLEEITPDGMIFSFKEYRFHLGAQVSGGYADTQTAPANQQGLGSAPVERPTRKRD